MWNRTSATLVMLLLALVAYLGRGTDVSVRAQGENLGPPLTVGDTYFLVYQRFQQEFTPLSEECVVREVQGLFVRCAPAKGSTSTDEWRNLAHIVSISKRAK
jgi:hypothetical protein